MRQRALSTQCGGAHGLRVFKAVSVIIKSQGFLATSMTLAFFKQYRFKEYVAMF